MNPIEMLKFHGNINRIKELDEAGFGVNAISGIFRDYNIEISENDVRSLLNVTNTLTKKALPKAEVKKLIDQNDLSGFQHA